MERVTALVPLLLTGVRHSIRKQSAFERLRSAASGGWLHAPAKNGFPGRLMSSRGSRGCMQGQIRANLLAETADIDMSACMHRILLWVCKNFNLATPNLEYYSKGLSLRNREIETETLILASISQR